jgi:hypothetical protein
MKNRSFHSGIRRSPYEAVFWRPVKLGLNTSKIPVDIIPCLKSEEDLEAALYSLNSNNHEDISVEISPKFDANNSDRIDAILNKGTRLENRCIVCQKCTSGAHKCKKCKNYVYVICGTSDSEEGYGQAYHLFPKPKPDKKI